MASFIEQRYPDFGESSRQAESHAKASRREESLRPSIDGRTFFLFTCSFDITRLVKLSKPAFRIPASLDRIVTSVDGRLPERSLREYFLLFVVVCGAGILVKDCQLPKPEGSKECGTKIRQRKDE